MSVQSESGADRVLCISVDNSPLHGAYFVDPGVQQSSTLSNPAVAPSVSLQAAVRALPAPASQAAFYDVGSPIPAATSDTRFGAAAGAIRAYGSGYWSLSTGGAGAGVIGVASTGQQMEAGTEAGGGLGQCGFPGSAGDTLGFYVNRPLQSCSRPVVLSQPAACASLSAQFITTALMLGASPQAAPGSAAGYVNVSLGSVFQLLAANGSTSLVQLTGAAAAAAVAQAALTVDPASGSCVCANAAVGVAYRVAVADATATVSGAAADVVLADLTQSPEACAAAAPYPVPFASAVAFVPDAASAAAIGVALSSLQPAARSGYPGYAPGSAVLAGAMVTASGVPAAAAASSDQAAVARSVPAAGAALLASAASNATGVGTALMGLHLRGAAADGSCAAQPSYSAAGLGGPLALAVDPAQPVAAGLGGPLALAVDPAQPVAVTFGDAAAVGCALRLDAVGFAELCAGSPGSTLQYAGLTSVDPTGTGLLAAFASRLAPTHVGTIGASDPLKAWQWVPLDAPAAPPGAAAYDDASGSCAGIVTGIDVEFLTAAVGPAANPQQRIVAARYAYATDTWRWAKEAGGTGSGAAAAGAAAALDGDGTQVFALRSTVTWVPLAAAAQGFVAPAPPIVPSLPSDLFYPFVTSTSAADQQLTISGAGAAALPAAGLLAAAAAATVAAAALWR